MSGLGRWSLPTGRIDRSDWWVRYVLLVAVLGLLASVLDATLFPDAWPRFADRPGSLDVADVLWFFPDRGGPLTSLVALGAAVPSVAATVTRLHDRDHSAWWLLWGLLAGPGWLVLFVTVGLLGTRPGHNRYGPPAHGGVAYQGH